MFDGLRRLAKGLAAHPIGRRRPVRSVANIVGWQVRSRLSPGPHQVKFINGTHLWARSGETGVTGNIYYGLHEFEDMAFVAHVLRPSDLFADIGANAGSYTVIAAGVAGARVIAIEPVPETIERLRANISLNGIEGQVRIEVCALTDKPGTIRFTTGHDTVNHVAADGETTGVIDVPARTADELFCEDIPLIMKIDVEGHEAELLGGAAHLLSDPRLCALLVEISKPGAEPVMNTLTGNGFAVRCYDPSRRRLSVASPNIGKGNTLFVRIASEARLARRTEEAKPILVHGERF